MAEKSGDKGTLSSNISGMSKAQLYDIMCQMKSLIEQNQQQAREILVQNPDLTRALFQAQIMLGMVKPPQSIPNIQPLLQPQATARKAPPPPPPPQKLNQQPVPAVSDPVPVRTQPQPPVFSHHHHPPSKGFSSSSTQETFGHIPSNPHILNVSAPPFQHTMAQTQLPRPAPMPVLQHRQQLRQPVYHHGIPGGNMSSQFTPPLPPQPPPSQSMFQAQQFHGVGQRSDPRLAPEFHNQGGSSSMPLPPVRGPLTWPPPPTSDNLPGLHAPPPLPPPQIGLPNQQSARPPLTPEMEKALLQQVMSLTPEQINLLPLDQRHQVLHLQHMLRSQ